MIAEMPFNRFMQARACLAIKVLRTDFRDECINFGTSLCGARGREL
jgi:hypothetical protein